MYNGILCSFKIEGNIVICKNMNKPLQHYTKLNNLVIGR